MTVIALFWLFLLSSVTAMFSLGGKFERQLAVVIVAAVFTTYAANASLGWERAEPFVSLVDACLLAFALRLVWVSDRYWPIWFAAFQSIALATGIAQLMFPADVPAIYTTMQGFWFFPAVIVMVVGVILDRQRSGSSV
jgi:hypothetical protein